jgi:hypothetical protein
VLSPLGNHLAITTAKGATRVGLAVIDVPPGGKAKHVAQFTDGDIWDVRWVNEGRLPFSVVDLSDGSGRPSGAPGLFAINPDGSKQRQLIRRYGKPFVIEQGRDRFLEWNHRLLRVPSVPAPEPGKLTEVNEEVLLAEFSIDDASHPSTAVDQHPHGPDPQR